jgi:branched-chain amino acid transport system permease protein
MPDIGFLFGQFLSGLTVGMVLFLIAAGLSLIFGVLGIINFAHGSFYMLGAYLAWQLTQWTAPLTENFWIAALGAAILVAALGGLVERFLLRKLYSRDVLYQLLFTYALLLILGDAAKMLWGTEQLGVRRPPILDGTSTVFGVIIPHYNLFMIILGPTVALASWIVLHRTQPGRLIRAAAIDREMLSALGADVGQIYTTTFMIGSFLAGLGGALVTPIKGIVPGMDLEIILEVFVIVVIGGLGSLWGTFLGALIYGQVLSFGILIFPRFSVFAVFILMAIVLMFRPAGLFGKPLAR